MGSDSYTLHSEYRTKPISVAQGDRRACSGFDGRRKEKVGLKKRKFKSGVVYRNGFYKKKIQRKNDLRQ